MQDTIAIDLKTGAYRAGIFKTGPAAGETAMTCLRYQQLLFTCFDRLSNFHCRSFPPININPLPTRVLSGNINHPLWAINRNLVLNL